MVKDHTVEPLPRYRENSLSSSAERQPGFLLLAVWFGLLTGLVEVALLCIRKFLFARILFLGPQFVWMTPVADVLLFIVPGLFLWFLAACWPRLVSFGFATFVFTFVGSLSLLLIYPRLNNYAVLLLAAGIAVQSTRILGRYPEGFHLLVRRTTGWMVGLVFGLFMALTGWEWMVHRNAVASLTPGTTHAPNVLLIVLDTVRAQSLSLHGYSRATTPNLEKLAATGVTFHRAIATSPWTTPSQIQSFRRRSRAPGHDPPDVSGDSQRQWVLNSRVCRKL
jgi:hypothetical protein